MKTPTRFLGCALLIVALGGVVYEWTVISSLRAETERLKSQAQAAGEAAESKSAGMISRLNAEIKRLAKETEELPRLRNEVGLLRKGSNDLVRLRGENLQLRQALKTAAGAAPVEPATVAESYFPKENWKFSGYSTPSAAFQSAVWAMNQGDYKTFMASLGPEMRAKFEKEFAGKTEEEFSTMGRRKMETTPGFRILEQTALSENEVILNVHPDGEPHGQKMLIRKMGNDWKLDGPYRENSQ